MVDTSFSLLINVVVYVMTIMSSGWVCYMYCLRAERH